MDGAANGTLHDRGAPLVPAPLALALDALAAGAAVSGRLWPAAGLELCEVRNRTR